MAKSGKKTTTKKKTTTSSKKKKVNKELVEILTPSKPVFFPPVHIETEEEERERIHKEWLSKKIVVASSKTFLPPGSPKFEPPTLEDRIERIMEKAANKPKLKPYKEYTPRELENLSTIDREKVQMHIYNFNVLGKNKWTITDVWFDAPARRNANLWNYDKLGRPFKLGYIIMWFSPGTYGLTEHFGLITSYFADNGSFTANPIKNERYIASWEKKLAKIGDAYITDTKLEVSRLRQEYGAFIIDRFYDKNWDDPEKSKFIPPRL